MSSEDLHAKLESPARRRVILLAEYGATGGTRTYTRQLLGFYAEEGWSVTLVSHNETVAGEIDGLARSFGFSHLSYHEVMLRGGVQSRPAVWSRSQMQAERNAFRKLAQALGTERVVVSTGTPGLFLGAVGSSVRGLYILHTYPFGFRQRFFGPRYLSKFIPDDTRIICVSDFQREVVNRTWRMKDQESRTIRIYSTTGPQEIEDHVDDSPFVVLTVGHVVAYKRPMEWIKTAEAVCAAMKSGSVLFRWLGDGPLLDQARSVAEKSPYRGQIMFVGHVGDVAPHYRRAAVYLQMSHVEALGLAVLDALRFGVPAIVSNAGGLPEVVEGECSGIVLSHNSAEFASREIVNLLQDPDTRSAFSRAARRRYAEVFSPQRWYVEMRQAHL